MPTITKTIGTTGRDYTTVASWEADLANAAIYTSGDTAVGECYADTSFGGSWSIDNTGFAFGLVEVILKAAEHEKHDGTPDSGVKFSYSGTVHNETAFHSVAYDPVTYGTYKVKIQDIEFADVSASINHLTPFVFLDDSCVMSRCLINNFVQAGGASTLLTVIGGSSGHAEERIIINNTMIFNCGKTITGGSSNGYVKGISFKDSTLANSDNNTLYNIYDLTPTASAWGVFKGISRNTISIDAGDCFKTPSTGSNSNNLSGDASAPGGSAVTSVSASDVFISTIQGSENLHLKYGSAAEELGLDLGTTNDVQYDIDSQSRVGLTWDIGADEWARVGSGKRGGFGTGFLISQEMGRFNLTDF